MAKQINRDDASGESIVGLMERLVRLLRASEYGTGLNPAQWEALRYLARANRFSNSPGALTQYLGATKGTISQTIKSLERKGYLKKTSRPDERRSVVLALTPKGQSVLTQTPWTVLIRATSKLGGKTRRRMEKGLRVLLEEGMPDGRYKQFGSCETCSHYSAVSCCTHFNATIAKEEVFLTCVAHQSR